MGVIWSQLSYLFLGGTPSKILMLGLDAAGKTSILYKIKLNESVSTIPTIGFNVESVEPVNGVSFIVWDIGGQEKIRGLWKHYFKDSHGLIFVVDSSDRERLSEAKEELHEILRTDEMKNVPFVVMANKQDLPDAFKPADLIDELDLRGMNSSCKWHIQGSCAISGDGIYEAMDALSRLVKDFKNTK